MGKGGFVVGAVAAVVAWSGCSSESAKHSPLNTCFVNGGASGGGSPEMIAISSLQFAGPSTWQCDAMSAGTAGGPQPIVDFAGLPAVLTPGASFSLGVMWSGGSVTSANIGVGNGAFVTIPLATGGAPAGSLYLPVRVDPNVCADLHSICHQLACCIQVVTASGKLSAAAATAMVLDCTNGVGCSAIGYKPPPSSCSCDPTWQQCDNSPPPCGAVGEACCSTGCNGGLACQNATCRAPGVNTGEPCVMPTDCAGNKPICIVKDSSGLSWPGGYCTSSCNPQKNDENGLNAACPGIGTCLGAGTTGTCERSCTRHDGSLPCLRQGYSCFQACEPTGESQCDPTVRASCPLDGGSPISSDGGVTTTSRVCQRIGADDVGLCVDGCDPFAQTCAPQNGQDATCYASFDTGEGSCTIEFGSGQTDGVPCLYLNACDPGFACYQAPLATQAVCRRYCGGPMVVPCQNGSCVDLSPTVRASTIGVCAP